GGHASADQALKDGLAQVVDAPGAGGDAVDQFHRPRVRLFLERAQPPDVQAEGAILSAERDLDFGGAAHYELAPEVISPSEARLMLACIFSLRLPVIENS